MPRKVPLSVDPIAEAKRQWTAHEPHPADGRAAMLVLTDSGRDLVDRATDALNADVFAAPGLSDDDTADLVRIIARLRKDAGDFDDPRPVPEPL